MGKVLARGRAGRLLFLDSGVMGTMPCPLWVLALLVVPVCELMAPEVDGSLRIDVEDDISFSYIMNNHT